MSGVSTAASMFSRILCGAVMPTLVLLAVHSEPSALADSLPIADQNEYENEFVGTWEGHEKYGQLFQMSLCAGGMARLGVVGKQSHRAEVRLKFRRGLWELRVVPEKESKLAPYELQISESLVGLRMDRKGWSWKGMTAGEPVFLRRMPGEADCKTGPRALLTHTQLVADRQVQAPVRAGGSVCTPKLKRRGIRLPGARAKLQVIVGRHQDQMRFGDIRARPLYIKNTGEEAIDFDSFTGQLDIVHEAMSPGGNWLAIETPAMRVAADWICGCGQNIMVLPRRRRWTILLPVYDGNFETQLRVRVETPLGAIYSKPFKGKIRREQLSL